jgi:hypothetical protein
MFCRMTIGGMIGLLCLSLGGWHGERRCGLIASLSRLLGTDRESDVVFANADELFRLESNRSHCSNAISKAVREEESTNVQLRFLE